MVAVKDFKPINPHHSDIIEKWNEGKSAGQIATFFAITRNSVIGVVFRARKMGIITRKDQYPTPQLKVKKVAKKPIRPKRFVSAVAFTFTQTKDTMARTPPSIRDIPEKYERTDGKDLLTLNPCDCRFSVGKGTFCGKNGKSSAKPWCEEHYSIVYTKKANAK